jgi:hypothetical protein
VESENIRFQLSVVSSRFPSLDAAAFDATTEN